MSCIFRFRCGTGVTKINVHGYSSAYPKAVTSTDYVAMPDTSSQPEGNQRRVWFSQGYIGTLKQCTSDVTLASGYTYPLKVSILNNDGEFYDSWEATDGAGTWAENWSIWYDLSEPTLSITISATKRTTCTVYTEVSPENGGSVTGAGQYLAGEKCTLSASPNKSYIIKHWEEYNPISGEYRKIYGTDGLQTYSFIVSKTIWIRVVFKKLYINVKLADDVSKCDLIYGEDSYTLNSASPKASIPIKTSSQILKIKNWVIEDESGIPLLYYNLPTETDYVKNNYNYPPLNDGGTNYFKVTDFSYERYIQIGNGYMVSYENNGGTGSISEWKYKIKELNKDLTLPDASCGFKKPGFNLVGWTNTYESKDYSLGGIYKRNSPAIMKAKWELIVTYYDYYLRYDANGGSGAPADDSKRTSDVSCDFIVGAAPTTSKTGCDFVGWSFDGVNLYQPGNKITLKYTDRDKTLKAVWKEKIVVTVVASPVVCDFTPSTAGEVYVAKNTTWTITNNKLGFVDLNGVEKSYTPAPATGYRFSKWLERGSGGTITTKETFTGQFIGEAYTVTFDANGGKVVDGQSLKERIVRYGDRYDHVYSTKDATVPETKVLPSMTKEHYTFRGWVNEKIEGTVKNDTPVTIASDHQLTAAYDFIQYNITFTAKNPTTSEVINPPTIQLKENGKSLEVTIPDNSTYAPTFKYYTFNGWVTNITGDTNVYTPGSIIYYKDYKEIFDKNKELKLYAVYTPLKAINVKVGSNQLKGIKTAYVCIKGAESNSPATWKKIKVWYAHDGEKWRKQIITS